MLSSDQEPVVVQQAWAQRSNLALPRAVWDCTPQVHRPAWEPPGPPNMTLFGNGVITDAIG